MQNKNTELQPDAIHKPNFIVFKIRFRVNTQSCEEDMEAQKTLYTPREAAEYLGVGYRAILDWIDKGELQCYRIGAGKWHIRISMEQIQDYLDSHKTERSAEE